MSKKKFRIGSMRQTQPSPKFTPSFVAMHARKAMNYLAPLIRGENIPPVEALILAFCLMDKNITGKIRSIPEDEVIKGTQIVMGLWLEGMFSLNENYPYTAEQTLAIFNKDKSEAE